MENLDDIILMMKGLASDAETIINNNKQYEVFDKGEFDIVTDVDRLVEQHCIGVIKQKYPNIPIVSEETLPNTVVENDAFFLDPIDGTKNFVYGLPTWGFQIAYVINKTDPVASVVYLPKLKIQVVSSKDKGTFINGEKIHKGYCADIKHSFWLLEGARKKWQIAEILFPQVLAVRNYGASSVSFSLALLRGANAIFCNEKLMWDYCAGLCACKNAGKICKILNDGTIIVCETQQQLGFALNVIAEAEKNG